jgi:hypothetical protein
MWNVEEERKPIISGDSDMTEGREIRSITPLIIIDENRRLYYY